VYLFLVVRQEAGRSDLGISILSPNGANIAFDATVLPQGERVTYEPRQPGVHLVYLTYGGLNVPGEVFVLITLHCLYTFCVVFYRLSNI